jgi:hypothetical protein
LSSLANLVPVGDRFCLGHSTLNVNVNVKELKSAIDFFIFPVTILPAFSICGK